MYACQEPQYCTVTYLFNDYKRQFYMYFKDLKAYSIYCLLRCRSSSYCAGKEFFYIKPSKKRTTNKCCKHDCHCMEYFISYTYSYFRRCMGSNVQISLLKSFSVMFLFVVDIESNLLFSHCSNDITFYVPMKRI